MTRQRDPRRDDPPRQVGEVLADEQELSPVAAMRAALPPEPPLGTRMDPPAAQEHEGWEDAPRWMSHTQHETKYPKLARMDASRERTRRRRYLEGGGDAAAYAPFRAFPCPGDLVLVERDGPIWMVACDACCTKFGVRREAIDRQSLAGKRMARSGLPKLLIGKKFESTPGTDAARQLLHALIENWDQEDRPRPPVLVGPNGTGKTHLLVAASTGLVRRHLIRVVYRSLTGEQGLMVELRRAIEHPDKSPDDVVEFLAEKPDLLVLDDLGAEHATDWGRDRIQQLIDLRYAWHLPMMASTNIPVELWDEAFGQRTASRLAGLCVAVEVSGQDWRQNPPEQPATETSDNEPVPEGI